MNKKSSKNSRGKRDRRGDFKSRAIEIHEMARVFEYLDTVILMAGARRIAGEIFERHAGSRPRAGAQTAHLYYDSFAIPVPAGMRRSMMSERRLKYMAGKRVIELSVTPVFPGRFELTGRIGDDVDRPTAVTLKGRRRNRTGVDSFGFFSFSGIDPGTYSLSFKTGTREIVLDGLELA